MTCDDVTDICNTQFHVWDLRDTYSTDVSTCDVLQNFWIVFRILIVIYIMDTIHCIYEKLPVQASYMLTATNVSRTQWGIRYVHDTSDAAEVFT